VAFPLLEWMPVPFENLEVSERIGISFLHNSVDALLIFLTTLFSALSSILRSRVTLVLENLALRHQITVLQRSASKRVKLTPLDRLLWARLSGIWNDWRSALVICSTRNGDCLASQGLWSVLEVEDSAGPAGKTHASPRSPRPGPQDMSRKSNVGRTTYPR
jgi:hypothetical protein